MVLPPYVVVFLSLDRCQFAQKKLPLTFADLGDTFYCICVYEAQHQSGVVKNTQTPIDGSVFTNTFCNSHKYILQFEQIHFAIHTNTFCSSRKYILQFEQIHFVVKNTQTTIDGSSSIKAEKIFALQHIEHLKVIISGALSRLTFRFLSQSNSDIFEHLCLYNIHGSM